MNILLLQVVDLEVFMLLVVEVQVVLYLMFLDHKHTGSACCGPGAPNKLTVTVGGAVLHKSIQVRVVMEKQVLTLPSLAQDHGV